MENDKIRFGFLRGFIMTNDYGNLELHTVLLKALVDFDSFCTQHNIKYVLHGGSCLGAVRHKGFIPWDDDVDIAMYRKDYERFLELSKDMYKEGYTIQTYKNDPKMLTNVMKICINNSGFVGISGAENDGEAFLDVFPMSDIPNSKILQRLQNKIVIFLNSIVYTKVGYLTPVSKKSKLIFGTLSKLPRRFLGDLIEICVKYFPHFKSKYVDIVATANYNNCTGYAWDLLPKSYIDEIQRVDFEGEKFYISKFWDEYLTNHYGDYMTPPKMENRVNKHDIKRIVK